jgi:alkyldihydroxyacetonephosphate synthase
LPWSRVLGAHAAILRALGAALEAHAGTGLVMAHLSHSHLDGACLYFTVIYPVDAGRALEQWTAIKREATEAILAAGGALSHHHGVGIDHAPWLAREKGALALAALRAAKAEFDPHGVMNPGKLL